MLTFDAPSKQFCNAETPDTDLPTALAAMSRMVDLHAAWLRNEFLAGTSPFEAASWPLKALEASGFADSRQAKSLAIEADARGVSVESIVERVLRNAQALGALEAVIAGTAGKHRDALKELKTADDVYGYDWRGGWPEV